MGLMRSCGKRLWPDQKGSPVACAGGVFSIRSTPRRLAGAWLLKRGETVQRAPCRHGLRDLPFTFRVFGVRRELVGEISDLVAEESMECFPSHLYTVIDRWARDTNLQGVRARHQLVTSELL